MRQYVEWVKENVTLDPSPMVRLYTFTTIDPQITHP
jgi:hypothetical protein